MEQTLGPSGFQGDTEDEDVECRAQKARGCGEIANDDEDGASDGEMDRSKNAAILGDQQFADPTEIAKKAMKGQEAWLDNTTFQREYVDEANALLNITHQ